MRTMEDKGAPNCFRFSTNKAPHGYNFVFIYNKHNDCEYQETIQYGTHDGLTWIKPQGESYIKEIEEFHWKITVPPGKCELLLIKTNPSGFGMSESSSRKIYWNDAKLMEMAKVSEENKQYRDENEKVCVNELKHDGGVFYLYTNSATDIVLKEEMELNLQNMEYSGDIEVLDEESHKILVKVAPGESKVLKFTTVGD